MRPEEVLDVLPKREQRRRTRTGPERSPAQSNASSASILSGSIREGQHSDVGQVLVGSVNDDVQELTPVSLLGLESAIRYIPGYVRHTRKTGCLCRRETVAHQRCDLVCKTILSAAQPALAADNGASDGVERVAVLDQLSCQI
jgi:hypothetical protein